MGVAGVVTTFGIRLDPAVKRSAATYEVRGMREHLTSYDHATVGSGSIVNDVLFAYNDFGQLTQDYQAHGGAVNTSTSPQVQYAYANGAGREASPVAKRMGVVTTFGIRLEPAVQRIAATYEVRGMRRGGWGQMADFRVGAVTKVPAICRQFAAMEQCNRLGASCRSRRLWL